MAATRLTGHHRRAFQAHITTRYLQGKTRLAETVFGWGRDTVTLGIHEARTGFICLGAQCLSGPKCWEERFPDIAADLRGLAEAQAQQDPTFHSTILYTRLTAQGAITLLLQRQHPPENLPRKSAMSNILNRMGFRLRRVLKCKPQKKTKNTDAIFENVRRLDQQNDQGQPEVIRISVDCKATVKIGELSRGGLSRNETKASDHDMEWTSKHVPAGILEQDSGRLTIAFGSSAKTSDFMADGLQGWWEGLDASRQQSVSIIRIKMDNGPESSGSRTQFLKRMVDWSDQTGKTIHLVYYPPYHSKYNPIERCWGVLEMHWNGAILNTCDKMVSWASTMTWKGMHPVVSFCGKIYEKGISLSKRAMIAVEARLQRNPSLPKWDITITPLPVMS